MIGVPHPSVPTTRTDPTTAQDPPPRLDYTEKTHAAAAAAAARRRYPGPAGQILAVEIENYMDMGFRVNPRSPVPRLIAELIGGG